MCTVPTGSRAAARLGPRTPCWHHAQCWTIGGQGRVHSFFILCKKLNNQKQKTNVYFLRFFNLV